MAFFVYVNQTRKTVVGLLFFFGQLSSQILCSVFHVLQLSVD